MEKDKTLQMSRKENEGKESDRFLLDNLCVIADLTIQFRRSRAIKFNCQAGTDPLHRSRQKIRGIILFLTWKMPHPFGWGIRYVH